MSKINEQGKAELLMHSMLYMFMSDIKRRKEKGTTYIIVLEGGSEIKVEDVKQINNNNVFTDFMKLVNGRMKLAMRIRNDTFTRIKPEVTK